MSFLGMGPFEIIIVLLVAFIVLGPERMADAARTLGKWTGEIRRMGAGARAEMDDLISEDAPRQADRRPAPADANHVDLAQADDVPMAFRGGAAASDTQMADKAATQTASPREAHEGAGDGAERNSRNSEENKA